MTKLAVVGCGTMGRAILQGLMDAKWAKPKELLATHPRREVCNRIKADLGIRAVTRNVAAVEADIILLGVKPQMIEAALKDLRGKVREDQLVLSIAAGISTKSIESNLPVPVVRCMPNLAVTVKQSASAICAGKFAKKVHMDMARQIFESVGTVEVVSQSNMDAVTGLSGTGPMYVVHMLEAMSDAGVKCGLPRNVASRLASQTVLGSAMLAQASTMHPAALKDQVSSPGGTSIAALHVLRRNAFSAIVMDAVEAATARSQQLGR